MFAISVGLVLFGLFLNICIEEKMEKNHKTIPEWLAATRGLSYIFGLLLLIAAITRWLWQNT